MNLKALKRAIDQASDRNPDTLSEPYVDIEIPIVVAQRLASMCSKHAAPPDAVLHKALAVLSIALDDFSAEHDPTTNSARQREAWEKR